MRVRDGLVVVEAVIAIVAKMAGRKWAEMLTQSKTTTRGLTMQRPLESWTMKMMTMSRCRLRMAKHSRIKTQCMMKMS